LTTSRPIKEDSNMLELNIKRPPGKDVMNTWGIAVVTSYLLIAVVVIIWTLIALWPPVKSKDEPAGSAFTSQTPTPTPGPASQTPTPPATQTPTAAAARQAPPAAQNATPIPNPTATPTPTAAANLTPAVAAATPLSTPDECAVKHRFQGEFCLNEKGEVRKGIAPAKVLWWCGCLYDEDRLLLLVLLAGVLGSLIHGLRSFVWYVGNRRAVWSWSAYYIALPFIGAGIAFIFYLVIRGGFFSTSATVGDTSPVGFAAIAALIGMFTEQAVQKLKSVSETILSPAEKGKDHIDGPKINSITPPQGPTSGGNEVKIAGENFSTPVKVTFGGVEATVIESTSDSVTLVVPAQPEDKEGKVDVVLINTDNQKFTQREGYEYKNPSLGGPLTSAATADNAETVPPAGGGTGAVDELDVHDVELKADTADEHLPITEGGVE
jgi:hypothetical protein